MRTTLAVLLFVLAVEAPSWAADIKPASDAPQPLSPKESAKRIRLPDGFRIDLVACEPLIQDPSCVAFDEFGRMFVGELHGYNVEGHLDVVELNKTGVLDKKVRRIRWELLGGKIAEQARMRQYGVVKLLTDTDGDGRMDKAEVWAKDLPPVYGILAARGGVIVACAPDIVFLADRDGDGKVDVRKTLFTGFATRVMERGINNPRWGLDDWIYVGGNGSGGTIRGPLLKQPVVLGNSDFRIKADGSAIEPVNGRVGTFGLTLNDIGDRFPCTGGQPAVYALPLPYRYLARNPHVASPAVTHSAANYARGFRLSKPHPWRVKRRQDRAWIKFYGERETDSSYFSGGCGGQIYRAERFPRAYRGNFFYCEPSLNIVHRCVLTRDGSGYLARRAPGEQRSEFLASTDQWFRPINLRLGPDGAIYIVDMYREIIEDYSAIPRFLQQQYGIVKGDDRGRVWRLAPADHGHREFPKPGSLSDEELVRMTGDANGWRRHTAQRLLIERGALDAAPLLSVQLHNGETPQARLHALYALEGLRALESAEIKRALRDAHYGVRVHGLRLADRRFSRDAELLQTAAAMVDDIDPRVRLQLAASLGESGDPRALDALRILAESFGDERWMAAAILSSARQSAGGLLVALLRADAADRRTVQLFAPLAATLAGRRDMAGVREVLGSIGSANESMQAECLKGLIRGLSQGGPEVPKVTNTTRPLVELLRSESPNIRELATRLGGLLRLTDSPELRAVFANAARVAVNDKRSLDERRRSMRLLGSAPFESLAAAAAQLLDARQPPALQQTAIEALGRSDDERVAATLLKGWRGHTPLTRAAVLKTVFTRENRIPALLDAVQGNIVPRGDISPIQREQLINSRGKGVAARARELFKNPTADAELSKRIERYRKALAGARDLEKGRKVFVKSCLACHKLKNEGFDVGPPLGATARKPDEAILIDLLAPSSHIEAEFRSYIVVTQQGKTYTGVLVSESATSVTLRKDKGVNETVLRKDIDVIKASELSLMPANLHEQISPADAASLISFLREAYREKKK